VGLSVRIIGGAYQVVSEWIPSDASTALGWVNNEYVAARPKCRESAHRLLQILHSGASRLVWHCGRGKDLFVGGKGSRGKGSC